MVTITLPDGKKQKFDAGATGKEVAAAISKELADNAVAMKLNGNVVDLTTPITSDSQVHILTTKDKEGMDVFRHSTAHLMAQAITELYPYAKLTIGPVVEEGFYYDIDHEPFKPEDLKKIEHKMHDIMKAKVPIERKEMPKKEALELFKDNTYKVEMINDLEEGTITVYKQGTFVDLCRGPHIPNTGLIKAFKLTKIAGAYWRGDEKNKQLQRLYGISFPTKEELEAHLKLIEEAEKRDHRKIGKDQSLFMFHEWAPGMPFFLPKGMIMLKELLQFVREYSYGEGYQEVRTPQILNLELWKVSGHIDHYKKDMFCMHHAEDNIDLGIKPMNCPAHMLVFKRDVRSYKELPLRIAETTTLYRNEKSGTLMGLTRVRSLSQDDTHIFLRQEQILEEIENLLEKIETIYKVFDLKIDRIDLSTRPEEYLGEKSVWDDAESKLKQALDESGLDYNINEGDGAFYGPKIDVKVKDALGRQWQLATIQLDYQLPLRFELHYDDVDGKQKTPVVIHRALLGSLERFMGVITEHYAGKFPLWLSPVQARILTVADRHNEYAEMLLQKFIKAGVRAEVDIRAESIPKKVREAQLQKINYILVVGDKEQENGTVNVRTRDNVVHGEKNPAEFIDDMTEEIKSKK